MVGGEKSIRLLLVDDEDEFRESTSQVLRRRGFEVIEAESGTRALELLEEAAPDLVVLDLKMEGMDGITTLRCMRDSHPALPVIILTGHGRYEDAIAGIRLDIVDFLRKPVDVEQLSVHIRRLVTKPEQPALRERSVAELMVPASSYRRIRSDEPVTAAVEALQQSLVQQMGGAGSVQGHRSIVVCGVDDRFVGMIRIADVLQLAIPPFMRDSPYASFYTGMLLAHAKTLENVRVGDLVRDQPTIAEDAPLMEAIHLMVTHHLINLPVVRGLQLRGVLRDRDLVQEILNYMGLR